jgi:hypothetical protein
MLSNFVSFLGSFRNRDEEVLHFFIIDFHHGDQNLILLARIVVFSDSSEDLLARNWHDSLRFRELTLLAP